MALPPGLDAMDLSQAGWGLIFAAGDRWATEILDALRPLLEHRREQAGSRYRQYVYADGYRADENMFQFLARHGVGPGSADPDRMPYYLLLVGDAQTIPFSFQIALDVQYAVGRISFDSPTAYAQYAHSVITAEDNPSARPARLTLFGVENPDDPVTQIMSTQLLAPLAATAARDAGAWPVETIYGADASKAHLVQLLAGPETPALLFAAGHGMTFPSGDPRQLSDQGALLCADWPGPQAWQKPIPEAFYLAADDVPMDADLRGAIVIVYASYSAGTPQTEARAWRGDQGAAPVAPYPFVARLPQRLLSLPGGSALAVAGMVERAWGYSFLAQGMETQAAVCTSFLAALMRGRPIGSACEYFNQRYAEMATTLSGELEALAFGKQADDDRLAGLWAMTNDARNMVVFGDPAVRLVGLVGS